MTFHAFQLKSLRRTNNWPYNLADQSNKLWDTMAAHFCLNELKKLSLLVQFYPTLLYILCALNFFFSVVAATGNLVAMFALWKASSIPANLKKLFLSLAFSDLAVGLWQLVIGGITTTTLTNGNYDFLCPAILTVATFFSSFLVCASFLTITAIAVDRLLAITLHLRYQELVTSKRVIIALVSLWLTSGVFASVLVFITNRRSTIALIVELVGLVLTTMAYFRIYKVVRYHRNQIQSHLQLSNVQDTELLREKKSALNSLFVYVAFLACYLPYLVSQILLQTNNLQISSLAIERVTMFLVLLNSSLNTVVYCWRYREIRELMKSTARTLFCSCDTGSP